MHGLSLSMGTTLVNIFARFSKPKIFSMIMSNHLSVNEYDNNSNKCVLFLNEIQDSLLDNNNLIVNEKNIDVHHLIYFLLKILQSNYLLHTLI